MNVILGLDGLEHDLVEKLKLKNLMQSCHGKTDISEFEEPRTIVIWSSFLTGENREAQILGLGKEKMWGYKAKEEDTFFSGREYEAVDVPGFNSDLDQHGRERQAMKDYFGKKMTVEEYDEVAFSHYRQTKRQYLEALEGGYDLVMGYFGVGDVVGHVSFGVEAKRKLIYRDFDDLAKKTAEKADKMLIISDHGMVAVGRFGDHSRNGFWSLNYQTDIENPRITDFKDVIMGWK